MSFQGLATRHRPSGEGLRAGVLRREESSSSITSPASSNATTKNPLGLKVNLHSSSGVATGPSRVTVSPARETTERKSSNASIQGSSPQSKQSAVEANGNSSPTQTSSSQSSTAAKPHPPTPHPKPPQAGKAPMSFLAEIQAAQKRRGLEESPEGSPPQPKMSPQKLPQTNSLGGTQNGGGGQNNQEGS